MDTDVVLDEKKTKTKKDHLFISYATEDGDLAEWLTLKLTAEGYKVWCDRVKLLGGESYPAEIDAAIKDQTFRMIALLSKHSINKPNPRKERTLALNLMNQRDEEFLIPINVDGLKPTDIDWMQNDITFILFHKNWDKGLNQLLKKLEVIQTPKSQTKGRAIAANFFLRNDCVKNEAEVLYSNCLQLEKLPMYLKKYQFEEFIGVDDRVAISKKWPFYKKDNYTVFSFQEVPRFLFKISHVKDIKWQDFEEIEGIRTRNIATNLIKKSIDVYFLDKGLKREIRIDENGKKRNGRFYFPFKLCNKDQLHFTDYKGKKNYVLACGSRSYKKLDGTRRSYNYHLSPNFIVRKDLIEDMLVIPKIELFLSDEKGESLLRRSYLSRRKLICKSWFNHQWLIRVMAIIQFLANKEGKIIIGNNSNEQLVIDATLIQFSSPVSISLKEPEEKDNVLCEIDIGSEEDAEEDGENEANSSL